MLLIDCVVVGCIIYCLDCGRMSLTQKRTNTVVLSSSSSSYIVQPDVISPVDHPPLSTHPSNVSTIHYQMIHESTSDTIINRVDVNYYSKLQLVKRSVPINN
jgi:hypothetical protein